MQPCAASRGRHERCFRLPTFSIAAPRQVQETEIISETVLIGRVRVGDKEEPLIPVITGRWHPPSLTAL